jgi:hypothetical protein
MKQFIAACFIATTGLAFANPADVVVSLTPANVCYNASIVTNQNGTFISGISQQIPCSDKPAKALPVNAWKKQEDKCMYEVGKTLTLIVGITLH